MQTKSLIVTFHFDEDTAWLYPDEEVIRSVEHFGNAAAEFHTSGKRPRVTVLSADDLIAVARGWLNSEAPGCDCAFCVCAREFVVFATELQRRANSAVKPSKPIS